MKKIIILVLAIMLAGLPMTATATAAADTNSSIITINPGVLPDSPFYQLKLFLERLQQTFTFNEQAKAEKLFTAAERRLAELDALPEEKQAQYAERLVNAFMTATQKAEKKQLKTKAVAPTETTDDDDAQAGSRAIEALERNLQKAVEAGRPSQHALAKALEKKIRLTEEQNERRRERQAQDDSAIESEEDEAEEEKGNAYGLQKKQDKATTKPTPPGQAKKPAAPETDAKETEDTDTDGPPANMPPQAQANGLQNKKR